MNQPKETNWNDLVSGNDLKKLSRSKSSPFVFQKMSVYEREEAETQGWQWVKTLKKNKAIFKKPKPMADAFEDRVWMTFATLGFTTLNRSRKFVIVYGPGQRQQIDIFAVDEECIVIVECKSTESAHASNFKKPIEALIGQQDGLAKVAQNRFPNRKVKFVWALSNYYLSKADKDRLASAGIECFTEDSLKYYKDLANHLGASAKYQLFAKLFDNEPIANFDNKVPAIECQLGGHLCYAFSIEPERLLKLGFILHHHSANDNMMPAYQRLIKKDRLAGIRRFVKDKGFFPNSLIVSINTHDEPMKFVPLSCDCGKTRPGILHLPPKYSSAYVIDGQHRLYAYSGLPEAEEHTVPVVAFVDLDQHEQLKMFMDINQNQKAVPKTLRVTLHADMLWDSPNEKDRRLAIASRTAQKLDDERDSPLSGRIMVGEDEPSPKRKVTVAAIQDAILKSGLLNAYNSKGPEPSLQGLLDMEVSDKTARRLYEFLYLCLDYVKARVPTIWDMTDDEATVLVTNRGIQALIRVMADVIVYLKENNMLERAPNEIDVEDLAKDVCKYLDPLCDFFEHVSQGERKELRTNLGGGADTTFWRTFQKVIHERNPEFSPSGLDDYLLNETKQFNERTIKQIDEIERAVKQIVYAVHLSGVSDTQKQLCEFPKKVYDRINKQINDFQYEHPDQPCDYLRFLTLSDCKELITTAALWSSKFSVLFTPADTNPRDSKKKKTAWMEFVSEIDHKLKTSKGYSVSKSDADKIDSIHHWITTKKTS